MRDLYLIRHIKIFRQGNEVGTAAYAAGGTGQPGASLPLLYRAKLVAMQGDGMLLQGWERPLGAIKPTRIRQAGMVFQAMRRCTTGFASVRTLRVDVANDSAPRASRSRFNLPIVKQCH